MSEPNYTKTQIENLIYFAQMQIEKQPLNTIMELGIALQNMEAENLMPVHQRIEWYANEVSSKNQRIAELESQLALSISFIESCTDEANIRLRFLTDLAGAKEFLHKLRAKPGVTCEKLKEIREIWCTEEPIDSIFVISELWTDSMENEISAAFGFRAAGFVTNEETAKQIVDESEVIEGTGWPFPKGQKIPKHCYEELKRYE